MPTDPTRPSFTPTQRRLLTAVAGLIVAVLAGAAFALTYDMLRDLALLGGVGRRWAPLYPAIADTLTALAILSLAIARNARWWTRLPRWTLLILLVAGGAAISVQDSLRGLGELPRDAVRTGVAVAPHLMLVTGVWLWLAMIKQVRAARPAGERGPPAQPQRDHVKVLEPAPPEPLALEAGAGPAPEHPWAFLDEPDPLIPFTPEEPAAPDIPEDRDSEDDFEREIFEEETGEPEPDIWSRPGLASGGNRPPEPRAPLDDAEPAAPPALLPTDVELVRGRDRDDRDERPAAATTRPDIPMPERHPADEDEHDTPPADRAEDPDADDRPEPADLDRNPPPSSNFRSGPTPPAD